MINFTPNTTKPQKIFSLPVNPFLQEEDFITKISPAIERNKDYIFDLYATVRIPPFEQDTMGGTFEDNNTVNDLALFYQEKFGIPVTAAFNNTSVSPSLLNMEIFIENFKPLYERGLKRIILPFQHWLLTGRIREEFPDLYIKNTILNEIYTPQEIYNSAKAGYDFIYIDRNIMRDTDTMEMYPLVKEKIKKDFNKDITLALLINEGCIGRCPIQLEHHAFNQQRETGGEKPYFSNPISLVSCTKWPKEDPAYYLKVSDIVPIKGEIERFQKYFEVFKLHGRDSINKLEASLLTIDNFRKGEIDLLPGKVDYYKSMTKDLYKYIGDTKNCKFQCWNCDLCEQNLKIKDDINGL